MRKRVLALALTLLLSVPVSAAWSGLPRTGAAYAGQLSDVTKDSPFYENIAALWEYGLTVGKADGSFGIKDNLTVGQTVIFAGRLRSLYQTGDPEKGPAAYRKAGQAAYEPYLLYLQGLKALGNELFGTYPQAATRAMSHGRTRLPNTTITATKIAASTAATPSSESPAPMLPISGKRIMRGTTARSCATSMPTMTRLERVPITPCSESDLRTTAVLESESNAPNHAASCHPKPSSRPSA